MGDLCFDVSLAEEAGGQTEFEIEGHEEGYLARIVVKEGQAAAPGAPVALMCETKEEVRETPCDRPAACQINVSLAVSVSPHKVSLLCYFSSLSR